MKIGNRKVDLEDIACLCCIIFGGVFATIHPEHLNDVFWKVVGAIVLIRLFW
jgi:hypothetical protein